MGLGACRHGQCPAPCMTFLNSPLPGHTTPDIIECTWTRHGPLVRPYQASSSTAAPHGRICSQQNGMAPLLLLCRRAALHASASAIHPFHPGTRQHLRPTGPAFPALPCLASRSKGTATRRCVMRGNWESSDETRHGRMGGGRRACVSQCVASGTGVVPSAIHPSRSGQALAS